MKRFNIFVSILISILLIVITIPFSFCSADNIISVKLNGNLGADFSSDKALSVTIDDTSLAKITGSGNNLSIVAKEGAVGIVNASVSNGDTQKEYQIPI